MNAGGTSTTGGTSSTGGTKATGGGAASGGSPSAGYPSSGGNASLGGASQTGGAWSTGGPLATGGAVAVGGTESTGGNAATGGVVATGGTAPTGGTLATGGTSTAGGVTNTGGISSTGDSTCTNTSTTVGAPGACCIQNGAYGCATNASVHKVVCLSGIWTALGDCNSGQLCDTRPGGTAGTCRNVVTECFGKNPGDRVCNVQTAETCGPDLVSVTTAQTCSGSTPVCSNGTCFCTPSTTQCDPGGSNGVQTCDSIGNWGTTVACASPTPNCHDGNCVISCAGTGGPDMVALPAGYCIDSTEVTQGQYQAWLNAPTPPSTSNQASECSWNTSFVPDTDCMNSQYVCHGGSCDSSPQVCVDWCDAYAYCAGVGKRLCGKIGGGSVAPSDANKSTQSQWYAACTSDGWYSSTAYVYGETYQANYCNNGTGTVAKVGTMPECQSAIAGYSGVYDLSGNVDEWDDCCGGTSQHSDYCRVRGGSFNGLGEYGECGFDMVTTRDATENDLGFRCCFP